MRNLLQNQVNFNSLLPNLRNCLFCLHNLYANHNKTIDKGSYQKDKI